MVNANTADAGCAGPRAAGCRAGPREARGGSEHGRRSGAGRTVAAAVDDAPHPRGAEPLVSAGIRADEHAASPSRTHHASSGGRPHARGMRRSGAASRRAQCVRLPLRGQHRLARLRCSQAPCFPFNCVRRRAHASTETRASVGGAGGSVKANGGAGCGRHFPVARSCRSRPASFKRPTASITTAIPMPTDAAARSPPAGQGRPACVCAGALCYRMRRVRCSRLISRRRS